MAGDHEAEAVGRVFTLLDRTVRVS
jgi:hypothetical protein